VRPSWSAYIPTVREKYTGRFPSWRKWQFFNRAAAIALE